MGETRPSARYRTLSVSRCEDPSTACRRWEEGPWGVRGLSFTAIPLSSARIAVPTHSAVLEPGEPRHSLSLVDPRAGAFYSAENE